jgi:D-tyrosyl-tRNA(Tyr) deacylase
MRVVLQRVSQASVSIDGKTKASIQKGMLLLLGITHEDNVEDIQWLCKKIAQLRIFSDENGLMNLDISAIGGEFLVISQFTLHASYKKGNRPSFIRAARPDTALPLYEQFVTRLAEVSGRPVYSGEFGADMAISLINDGPVTLTLDSKEPE